MEAVFISELDTGTKLDEDIKLCKWCNKPITDPSHGLEKYCSDKCREEAHKEQKRNWRNQFYRKNKTRSILSQTGTTTISPYLNNDYSITYLGRNIPFSDFRTEFKTIQNETKRTLNKNSLSTTKYKEGYYKKGYFTFKYDTSIQDKNPPLGIQLTHNYTNFNDYTEHSKRIYNNVHIKTCPECQSNDIRKDRFKGETYCFSCGVVLHGFPHHGIKYPYNIDNTIPQQNKKFDPMEYYINDEPEPKHSKYQRPDKTEIDVICKSCYKPHTIERYLKEDFRCECGSHVMGIGICLPRDYDDEFGPKLQRKHEKYFMMDRGYDMRPTEERD